MSCRQPRPICVLLLAVLACLPASSTAQTLRLWAAQAARQGPSVHAVAAAPKERRSSPLDGKGYVTGLEQPADELDFTFHVAEAGVYRLAARYRAAGQKGYELDVDGSGLSGLFPPTAGGKFATWPLGRVRLQAGRNRITVHRGWGFYDLAALELTPAAPERSPLPVNTLPVDPEATPEAKALLARLEAGYGKATAMGVYSDEDAAYVRDSTGRLPAVMGGDLMRLTPEFRAHEPLWQDDVARLIADARTGYLVTLSWHWPSPSGGLDTPKSPWWRSFYTDGTTFDASRAVNPTAPEHAEVIADIDAAAVQLRRLQDAHVPVLFRPLHEAQGGWFWWGAKGPAVYRQLWALVFDRLTQVDGIHNLLWVYTAGEDGAWYPGDNRADIIGVDAYPTDLHDAETGLWDTLLPRFDGRKPLAISEFGGVPDLPHMEGFGEAWMYAVSWSGDLGPRKNTLEELRRIYGSSGVASRPAVPEGAEAGEAASAAEDSPGAQPSGATAQPKQP